MDLAMLLYQQEAWGSLPWDLRAMALWRTGRVREAAEAAEKAAALEPGNERLRRNAEWFAERY